jgi:TetR/AcrR family transcriptional repressor of mexJK operon
MSAISNRRRPARFAGPRPDDPRVVRTREAVVAAARELFVRHGFSRTTMDDIAARAGVTKRTLYNNYADKEALFRQIVAGVTGFADAFTRGVRDEFDAGIPRARLRAALRDLGERLALGIVRTEVVALRRMLVDASREFPALAREYFDRAPGQVMRALTAGFGQLQRSRVLRAGDAHVAAAQFAYLVVGEHLDRAMLTGALPSPAAVKARAREGVETFLARYGTAR